MTRLFTALVASAMFLSLGAPSFATASPKPMAKASPMAKMATTKSCPKGETYVKGYTKSNGTKVKGYCRKAA